MSAAGEPSENIDTEETSIASTLIRFLAGTEQSKSYGERVSKNVGDLKPGPFREMSLKSTTKRALAVKHMNDKQAQSEVKSKYQLCSHFSQVS